VAEARDAVTGAKTLIARIDEFIGGGGSLSAGSDERRTSRQVVESKTFDPMNIRPRAEKAT
jgi:hypothetical protein